MRAPDEHLGPKPEVPARVRAGGRSMTVGVGANATGGLLGRLATSRSGRDAGAVYLVVGAESATVVFVADGRTRSVAHPKRKNVKHLELGASFPAMVERLAAGPPLTDEDLRAVIAAAPAEAPRVPDG